MWSTNLHVKSCRRGEGEEKEPFHLSWLAINACFGSHALNGPKLGKQSKILFEIENR